ncbi:MAG: hypothetical protein KDK24_00175 [Pseudooceanicola sp.]|nr:hypothetical protein [Pseudooceanicola sp.]
MVNSNKILTVSYGTFSCTLEGFEDSFGTMKEIAEYFRDLAADDRYFGAEPPQPDAETLARIAEKEVRREARPGQEPTRIEMRAPEPAPRPRPVAVPSVAPQGMAGDGGDSIAARLQRIRAVASQAPSVQSAFVEDPDAEAPLAPAAFAMPEEVETLDSDIGEITAAMEADDAAMELTEAAEDLAASAEIGAALDLMQAQDGDDGYDEVYDQAQPGSVAALVRSSEEYVLADEGEEPVIGNIPSEDDDVLLADEDDAAAFDEDADDLAPAEAEVDLGPAEELAEEAEVENAPFDDLDLSAILDDEEAPARKPGLFSDLEDDDADDEAEDGAGDEEVINILGDETYGDGPRLLKVSRSELDAAIAAGDLEEVEEEEAPNASALTPEQEDDLARELASVLADDAEDDRATRAFGEVEAEDDMPRLMADAEKRMDAPESSSNREAYSHLRAAVAAAKADRSVARDPEAEKAGDAYRDDLASVVRPRRPVQTAMPRPERPAEPGRPAPLRLVAEQRIDLDEATRGPVRPRRLSQELEPEAETEQDQGFARYVREQGATELPQLLEAAAAYLAFVEGQAQFSRPQLMRKLRQLDNQEFNREDGLRTFGQLLREGKIEKTGGGRFAAAQDIGFQPGQRAAG